MHFFFRQTMYPIAAVITRTIITGIPINAIIGPLFESDEPDGASDSNEMSVEVRVVTWNDVERSNLQFSKIIILIVKNVTILPYYQITNVLR